MSPALNRSSVIWHFEHGDAIKICNGIIDFYMGLPHIIIILGECHHCCVLPMYFVTLYVGMAVGEQFMHNSTTNLPVQLAPLVPSWNPVLQLQRKVPPSLVQS